MEITELSLAPTQFVVEKSSSSESENKPSRKRKLFPSDHLLKTGSSPLQTSVDLHVKDPLPVDWEQCLDLESGRMYYLNRKTLRKTWNWPKDQNLDLELNISTLSNCLDQKCSNSNLLDENPDNRLQASSSNMVALACLNCHLLVILSKSSPSCPNCKYVHSLPTLQTPQPKVSVAAKSINTLSLLN